MMTVPMKRPKVSVIGNENEKYIAGFTNGEIDGMSAIFGNIHSLNANKLKFKKECIEIDKKNNENIRCKKRFDK